YPSDGLQFHALLSEGGPSLSALVGGRLRTITPEKAPAWKPGHIAPQAFQAQPGVVIALDDQGDFEKDQVFSAGAWVKAPRNNQTGAVIARMDDAAGYRG